MLTVKQIVKILQHRHSIGTPRKRWKNQRRQRSVRIKLVHVHDGSGNILLVKK